MRRGCTLHICSVKSSTALIAHDFSHFVKRTFCRRIVVTDHNIRPTVQRVNVLPLQLIVWVEVWIGTDKGVPATSGCPLQHQIADYLINTTWPNPLEAFNHRQHKRTLRGYCSLYSLHPGKSRFPVLRRLAQTNSHPLSFQLAFLCPTRLDLTKASAYSQHGPCTVHNDPPKRPIRKAELHRCFLMPPIKPRPDQGMWNRHHTHSSRKYCQVTGLNRASTACLETHHVETQGLLRSIPPLMRVLTGASRSQHTGRSE